MRTKKGPALSFNNNIICLRGSRFSSFSRDSRREQRRERLVLRNATLIGPAATPDGR